MCSVWLPESFEYFTAQVTHFICIWHLFLLCRWSLCAARSFQYVSVHAKMPVSTQFLLLCNVDDAQIKILVEMQTGYCRGVGPVTASEKTQHSIH